MGRAEWQWPPTPIFSGTPGIRRRSPQCPSPSPPCRSVPLRRRTAALQTTTPDRPIATVAVVAAPHLDARTAELPAPATGFATTTRSSAPRPGTARVAAILRKTRSPPRAAQLPQRHYFSSGFSVSGATAATSGPLLSGADGKPISAWGKVTKKLTFGLHDFIVSFILAAVSKPILGIDFLSAHRLLVDPFSRAVLFASSLQPVGCTVVAATLKFVTSIYHIVPAVRSLLSSFPSIVGDGKGTPWPRHGIRHFVETSGRLVFAKARRLDPDKLKFAEAEFRSLEAAGIVRRSNSPWSFPLHMVPKANGSWWPYRDYRRLNTVNTPDRYPLPSMLDLLAKIHGCKFFSCVDSVKGYHQIPMAAEGI
jgi:hypothetical protein